MSTKPSTFFLGTFCRLFVTLPFSPSISMSLTTSYIYQFIFEENSFTRGKATETKISPNMDCMNTCTVAIEFILGSKLASIFHILRCTVITVNQVLWKPPGPQEFAKEIVLEKDLSFRKSSRQAYKLRKCVPLGNTFSTIWSFPHLEVIFVHSNSESALKMV